MELLLNMTAIDDHGADIAWQEVDGTAEYHVYWADKDTDTMEYRLMSKQTNCSFRLNKSTHVPHFIRVEAVGQDGVIAQSKVFRRTLKPQLEKLNRGLIAVKAKTGIFLSWRMMLDEVSGYSETGMTGTDYVVYKNGKKLVLVTDSTNYIDTQGTEEDEYCVAPLKDGAEGKLSAAVKAWSTGKNYFEIPMHIPEGGVTPAG